jgi:hypothetical protein
MLPPKREGRDSGDHCGGQPSLVQLGKLGQEASQESRPKRECNAACTNQYSKGSALAHLSSESQYNIADDRENPEKCENESAAIRTYQKGYALAIVGRRCRERVEDKQ